MFVYVIHTIMGDEFEDVSSYSPKAYLDYLNDEGDFIICTDSEGNSAIIRKDQISCVEEIMQ